MSPFMNEGLRLPQPEDNPQPLVPLEIASVEKQLIFLSHAYFRTSLYSVTDQSKALCSN